jgi:hypothetical protein
MHGVQYSTVQIPYTVCYKYVTVRVRTVATNYKLLRSRGGRGFPAPPHAIHWQSRVPYVVPSSEFRLPSESDRIRIRTLP